MSDRRPEPVPGIIRNPIIEHRARVVAAAAMSACRGRAPGKALANYASEEVCKRLACRARAQRTRQPDPGYESRTHLMLITRDVVEASVVVFRPGFTRSVAMRLERQQRVWRAVELVIV